MSRWMVRTLTSIRSASASAVTRPWLCSVRRIRRSRSARTRQLYGGNRTGGVVLLVVRFTCGGRSGERMPEMKDELIGLSEYVFTARIRPRLQGATDDEY